ncbi:aminotransferase class IV [Kiritimatiellota bacterium B12222]|nr:aminotransferase class IV [Kiritimatiellota bacterium B12222]
MKTPCWSMDEILSSLSEGKEGCGPKSLVMYSSLRGAMVTDPRGMFLPIEDHLVHRGDGVFETLLFEGGGVYNLSAHLERLIRSASAIGLSLPFGEAQVIQVIEDCFAQAGKSRSLARVLLGRGTGGFSVDPAESVQSSLYVMVYEAPPPFMTTHPEGARAVLSAVPPKSGGLATIKTCNYIPNAMMKAEANAAGVHFAIGVDAEGFVTESATENIAGVDREGTLIYPPPTSHLPGTTLQRVVALAASEGRKIENRAFRPSELFEMAEVLVVGTTTYVTPLIELDGRAISVGPVAGELHRLLMADIYNREE